MEFLQGLNDKIWLLANKKPPKRYEVVTYRAVAWGLPFMLVMLAALMAGSLMEYEGGWQLYVFGFGVICYVIFAAIYMARQIWKYEDDRGIAEYCYQRAVGAWKIKHGRLTNADWISDIDKINKTANS